MTYSAVPVGRHFDSATGVVECEIDTGGISYLRIAVVDMNQVFRTNEILSLLWKRMLPILPSQLVRGRYRGGGRCNL
jgi:hypothetical protein